MGRRHNGGIVGVRNATTSSSAKGRFSLNEVLEALKGTIWPSTILVDYLVVAGGGGGSDYGGGGAGGYRELTGQNVVIGQAYTVTVGGGGAGGATGTSGSNSVLSSTTSTGGGRGGKQTQAMEQLEVLVVVEVINQTVALEIRQAQRQAKEIVEEMAMV